ncbi:AsmA family protein [Polycladidibacter stylochi]|uniref:AsmA family protein n=1 Tax=Polycladidibacter stylochi TaxID=1807766 RepID=UPI0008366926|nr:AsmA family protein [Pseudovibrio stylochi]
MNSVYITIGSALILALVTALVGPMFIDWSAYRATFEEYGERMLGHDVAVLGNVEVRLLPAPSVSFSDIRVGDNEAPLLVIAKFESDLDLPSLFHGELRVVNMKLERPQLRMGLDEQGKLDILRRSPRDGALAHMNPSQIQFDRVEITNGSFQLTDARSTKVYHGDNANFLVSARGLSGPYKAEGSLDVEGAKYEVQLATGRAEGKNGIRVKSKIRPEQVPVEVSLDGYLKNQALALSYEGDASFERVGELVEGQVAYHGHGQFTADSGRVELSAFDVEVGSEARSVKLDLNGVITLAGTPAFELGADFKQIDMDRLLGGGPQEPVNINHAFASIISYLNKMPLLNYPGYVRSTMPSIVVNGGVIADVQLAAGAQANGWTIDELKADLPGRGAFTTNGFLEVSSPLNQGAGYRGEFKLVSGDSRHLARWISGQSVITESRLKPFVMQGRLRSMPGEVSLTDLRLDLDGGRSVGTLSYKDTKDGVPLVAVDMDSDRIDVDMLRGFAQAFAGEELTALSNADLNLRLYADELLAGGVSARSMIVRADLMNDTLVIDELRLKNLAGASVRAHGTIRNLRQAPTGEIDADLDASSLVGLTQLLQKYAPKSGFIKRLALAAPALAPAKLTGKLEATGESNNTSLNIGLSGSLGVNEFDFNTLFEGQVQRPYDGRYMSEVSLGGGDGVAVLQQLGFAVVPLAENSPGDVRLSLEGVPSAGIDYTLMAQLGGADLVVEGQSRMKAKGAAQWTAMASLRADDLIPLAMTFGHVMPIVEGALSTNLEASLNGVGRKYTLSELRGQIDSVSIEGDLKGQLTKAGVVRGTGHLRTSELDLRLPINLLLGVDPWGLAETDSSVWSIQTLGGSSLAGVNLDVDVTSDKLFLANALELDGAKGKLKVRENQLAMSAVSGVYADGALEGAFDLTRNGQSMSLTGRLRVDDADASKLMWRKAGEPVASGRLQAIGEFEGMGRSAAGLIAGLTGGGTFSISDGEMAFMSANAFDETIKAVDEGLPLEKSALHDVFVEALNAGSMPFEQIEGNIGLDNGRLRLRSVRVQSDGLTIFGGGAFDLENWRLSGDVAMKRTEEDDGVSGSDPQASFMFSGSLFDPVRDVDVAPFLSYLNLRSIEHNVKRIEEEQKRIALQEKKLLELKRKQAEEERLRREEQARHEAEQLRLEKLERERAAQEKAKKLEQPSLAPEIKVVPLDPLELDPSVGNTGAQVPATPLRLPSNESRSQGVSQSFLDKVNSALKGDHTPTEKAGQLSDAPPPLAVQPPLAKPSIGLPALDAPQVIGGRHEALVPGDAVKRLGAPKTSGEPKILVAPGDSLPDEDAILVDPSLLPGSGEQGYVEQVPQKRPDKPLQRRIPKYRELPGERIMPIN